MRAVKSPSHFKLYGWLLLILLAAVFLRLFNLSSIPPGITHDEADHGITAWSIANEGVRELYFTVGYGREPLYDYVIASVMTFLGPTYLAGRITAAYFSIILVAAMFSWVRSAFNESTALLTAAGLAVGFWPVMAGRQALRSTLLPALFVLAVFFFWRGLEAVRKDDLKLSGTARRSYRFFVIAGLFLGLTFYTYIPARGLWMIFPALLVYLFFLRRSLFQRTWWPTIIMLIVMLITAAPLLYYLVSNPVSELRIQQLATPLNSAAAGDFGLLLDNVQQSLRLFFIEGDTSWRYNIAGKPLLGPLMGLLLLLGIVISIWYALIRRTGESLYAGRLYGPASFLALAWLVAGFLPVFITGSTLAMTQAVGMQPVLYLFPALALVAAGQLPVGGKPLAERRWAKIGLLLLFVGTAVFTYRDYFLTWANSPEVRVQYESTIATALDYLNEHGDGSAAISTITPDRYHSPAVAQMRLQNEGVDLHWFDARSSLILPDMGESRILIPGFAPIAPALESYFSSADLEENLPLRETDLDRPLSIYFVDGEEMLSTWEGQLTPANAQFADNITLLGYDLQPSDIAAGEDGHLITLWQAKRPLEEAVLFAHILGTDGVPIAQKDQLGVPGYAWQSGDLFLQLHEFSLPPEIDPGQYPVAVGIYTQPEGERLQLSGAGQNGDLFYLTSLTISP